MLTYISEAFQQSLLNDLIFVVQKSNASLTFKKTRNAFPVFFKLLLLLLSWWVIASPLKPTVTVTTQSRWYEFPIWQKRMEWSIMQWSQVKAYICYRSLEIWILADIDLYASERPDEIDPHKCITLITREVTFILQ